MSATYFEGHIKRDPDTNASATYTSHGDGPMQWLIASTKIGAHAARTDGPNFVTEKPIAQWDDVYTAPNPEPEPRLPGQVPTE